MMRMSSTSKKLEKKVRIEIGYSKNAPNRMLCEEQKRLLLPAVGPCDFDDSPPSSPSLEAPGSPGVVLAALHMLQAPVEHGNDNP